MKNLLIIFSFLLLTTLGFSQDSTQTTEADQKVLPLSNLEGKDHIFNFGRKEYTFIPNEFGFYLSRVEDGEEKTERRKCTGNFVKPQMMVFTSLRPRRMTKLPSAGLMQKATFEPCGMTSKLTLSLRRILRSRINSIVGIKSDEEKIPYNKENKGRKATKN